MALPLILENALNQLDQRGVILIYNNTKRAIHSGGSFVSSPLNFKPYTLHLTLYTLRLISYFATTTLQNELLVIIDQQKVDFILIFAA